MMDGFQTRQERETLVAAGFQHLASLVSRGRIVSYTVGTRECEEHENHVVVRATLADGTQKQCLLYGTIEGLGVFNSFIGSLVDEPLMDDPQHLEPMDGEG